MILPREDRYYNTKKSMEDQIVHLLGGRVAEMLVLSDISTGASNDIQRATELARDMVTKYGFSEKLGPINYASSEEVFLGRDFGAKQAYSEETANEIDEEVKRIVHDGYEKAQAIINEHMDKLLAVTDALMELETIDGAQFEKLYSGEMTAEELIAETRAEDEKRAAENRQEAQETEEELKILERDLARYDEDYLNDDKDGDNADDESQDNASDSVEENGETETDDRGENENNIK